MIRSFNYFLRTAVLAVMAGLVLYGVVTLRGFFQAHRQEIEEREQRIQELDAEVARGQEVIRAQEAEIQELAAALKLLKVDHRVARIEVLGQEPLADGSGRVRTSLRFQEIGPEGEALGEPAEIDLLGKVAYLDALVIKFQDEYVEKGDFLRGTSICLFRRLFGEYQKPNEGFPIDAAGVRPRAYSAEKVDPAYEAELWERFWDYANDRRLAESKGVRAVQGEAPYMELRPGKVYRIELRASGGLSILTEN